MAERLNKIYKLTLYFNKEIIGFKDQEDILNLIGKLSALRMRKVYYLYTDLINRKIIAIKDKENILKMKIVPCLSNLNVQYNHIQYISQYIY